MKKNIKLILCGMLVILCTVHIKAQTLDEVCEDGKGISTNPENPINLEAPAVDHWRLNDFDWKIQNPTNPQNNENYFYHFDPNTPNQPIINPFSGPSTTDIDYYEYLTAGDASDYHPADGWELMKVDFGKAPEGTLSGVYPTLPHMMLYNKYTGTLRFFGVLRNPSPIFSVVEVKMSIPKYSPGADNDYESTYQRNLNATNMLSIQGESIQPLDQETSENTLSVFVNYTNNNQTFFWFDVPLAYDPCVCQFKSQFNIDFEYVQEADITLSGDITGKIETVEDLNDPSKNKAVKGFTTVLAAGISTALAVKTGGAVINVKAYKELVDLIADNTSDPSTKASLETLSTAIGCGGQQLADILAGNFGKWEGDFGSLSEKEQTKRVAKAKKIVESSTKFFSSVEKGCVNGKSTAKTVITGRVEASGSVITRTDIQGDEILMGVPGSKWDIELSERSSTLNQPYNKLVPAYPMYNERVGTFAMLKTPKIDISSNSDVCWSRSHREVDIINPIPEDLLTINTHISWSMKVSEDLLYSFNPTLNLDPDNTTILVRVVGSKDDDHFSDGAFINNSTSCQNNSSLANPLNISAVDGDGGYVFYSPYMPIDYFKSMPMRFSWRFTTTRFVKSAYPDLYIDTRVQNEWRKSSTLAELEDNLYVQFK